MLRGHQVTIRSSRHECETLDQPASALLIALHAAHHGPSWNRARTDLRRACELLDRDCWLRGGAGARSAGRSCDGYRAGNGGRGPRARGRARTPNHADPRRPVAVVGHRLDAKAPLAIRARPGRRATRLAARSDGCRHPALAVVLLQALGQCLDPDTSLVVAEQRPHGVATASGSCSAITPTPSSSKTPRQRDLVERLGEADHRHARHQRLVHGVAAAVCDVDAALASTSRAGTNSRTTTLGGIGPSSSAVRRSSRRRRSRSCTGSRASAAITIRNSSVRRFWAVPKHA